MSLARYKTALLDGLDDYKKENKGPLSSRRKTDVEELKYLIQNENNFGILQTGLISKVNTLKTGWWIFNTGRSQLKKYLLQVVHNPDYAVDKIIAVEMAEYQKEWTKQKTEEQKHHEQFIQKLQVKADQLAATLEQQQLTLQERQCQLELLESRFNNQTYHLAYEEYLINLMDKFVEQGSVSVLEARQLLKIIDYAKSNFEELDEYYHSLLSHKMIEVGEYALQKLSKGLDDLVSDAEFKNHTFECLSSFADFYGDAFQKNFTGNPYFTRQMDRLLQSYYRDGANKTMVCDLSFDHKTAIFEAKEQLIILYGEDSHRKAITPLIDLRLAARFEDFKKHCLEKLKVLSQWLSQKKRISLHPESVPSSEQSVDSNQGDIKTRSPTL